MYGRRGLEDDVHDKVWCDGGWVVVVMMAKEQSTIG